MAQMADGAEQEGIATHAARWAAEMGDDAGRWLEDRDPSGVLEEVKGFARRRPGMFVLIAAGAGLLAGRVARSLRDEATDDDDPAGAGAARDVAGIHRPGGSLDAGDRHPPVPNPGPVPSAERVPSSPDPQTSHRYPGDLR